MTAALFAHEVQDGVGAATVSALTAVAMGVVLLLLVALVFARRSAASGSDQRTEAGIDDLR